MSKRMKLMLGIGVLLGLLGVLAAVPVLAQGNTPPTTPTPQAQKGWGFGRGMMGPGFGRSWAEFDAAAEALGLTPEELFSQLHSGKTLEEIAQARGVDLEKVWEAVRAARVRAMKEAIQQAVKDGRMSQEQADWLLEGLEKGYFPIGPGFRRGFGRGFGRGNWGRGPWGCPGWSGNPATPTPSGTSP